MTGATRGLPRGKHPSAPRAATLATYDGKGRRREKVFISIIFFENGSVFAMANQILKDAADLVSDALGVKDLVQLGVYLTQQGIDAGSKAYTKRAEERSALVEVPELYSNDYRLKLDDARRWLEEDGLKVEAVVVQPDIAFKDCSDFEVVATNYELKQKVKPGTRIIVKYVTSEVIEASQRLYDEIESQKIEDNQRKAEQAAKKKENFDKTVTNVQHGISGVVTNAQKGIKGIFSNLPTKEKKGE